MHGVNIWLHVHVYSSGAFSVFSKNLPQRVSISVCCIAYGLFGGFIYQYTPYFTHCSSVDIQTLKLLPSSSVAMVWFECCIVTAIDTMRSQWYESDIVVCGSWPLEKHSPMRTHDALSWCYKWSRAINLWMIHMILLQFVACLCVISRYIYLYAIS